MQHTNDSLPIVIGTKGKPVNWAPLQVHMQTRLGYIPSLSAALTSEELGKLGFKAASGIGYTNSRGGFYDGR